MSSRPLLLSFCAVALAAAAGCSIAIDLPTGLNARKDLKARLEVPASPEVIVDVRHGSIDVEPGDDGAIVVEAESRAENDAEVAKIGLIQSVEGKVARIGWETTDQVYDRRQVSLKLKVPKDSVLKLKSGAGSIAVSMTTRGLDARTNAGEIRVDQVVGDLTLETGAGAVKVAGADGTVKISTNAGSLDLAGRFRGENSAKSSAGAVQVALPADAKLKVEASSGAGSLDNDFGWKRSKGVGGSVAGTLGDGSEGSFVLRTNAGSVRIKKLP